MPAQAGIHLFLCQPKLHFVVDVDSRLRGNDVVAMCHARKGVMGMDSIFRGNDEVVVCHARVGI
jgi:hypothetical protein